MVKTRGRNGYYSDKLSAEKLMLVYETAPARIRQYLEAEIAYVMHRISSGDTVLDLGCGYGRVIPYLANKAGKVVGIDKSLPSLRLGKTLLPESPKIHFLAMDAGRPSFCEGVFDVIVCIQNGISAFHIDQKALLEESHRLLHPGGLALFSSYSTKFWEHRLEWFELQARKGLLGEIDHTKTGNGVIVCKDGFLATTVDQGRFKELTSGLDADVKVFEVDESSLFCEIRRKSHPLQ